MNPFHSAHDPHADQTVLALIEAQTRRAPDHAAVEQGAVRLSYAELDRRAERLARAVRAAGAGPGDLVGVLLERSPELVVAILAVLRAGAAYVPLDPAYPDARLRATLDDSGAALLVTERAHAARAAHGPVATLVLDDLPAAGREAPEPLPRPRGDDLAYCIYTSGSTGAPKGVLIDHRALRSLIGAVGRVYGVTPDDRALQFASPSFDISVEEIFVALAHGATLVLREPAMTESYAAFARACRALRLTVLNLPTAFWHALAHGLTPDQGVELAATVRLVIVGGEAAHLATVGRWQGLMGGRARLINAYGPTEATVTATTWEAPARLGREARDALAPIGAPLPHLRALVLDDDLRPVAPGAVGELYLGGASLARGYLGRPALTAERFVSLPALAGPGGPERWYRTGDLARCGADGALVWVGRADQQVKVRGYRVEPGEVEAALHNLPEVAQAAVVAVAGRLNTHQLLAFVTPAPGAAPTPARLRAALAAVLPEHMLPARITLLPRLPATVAGKVDRGALAALAADEHAHGAPLSPEARRVADLFALILGAPVTADEDDFFALGGDSLAAMELLVGIADEFGLALAFSDLYAHSSVSALAGYIAGRLAAQGQPSERAAVLARAQTEFGIMDSWLLVRALNLIGGYTLLPEIVPVVLRLRGRLDPATLQAAVNAIVARHDALRTVHLTPRGLLLWRPLWPLVRWVSRRRRVIETFTRIEMWALARSARGGRRERARSGPGIGARLLHGLIAGRKATLPALTVLMPQTDLAHLPADEQAAALDELMRREWWAGTQTLEGAPPLRLRLFRLGPEEHVLTVNLDHRVTDGESAPIFIGELVRHYAALQCGGAADLPPLAAQLADYQAWCAAHTQPQILADLPAWAELHRGIEPRTLLRLPFERGGAAAPDYVRRQAVREQPLDAATLAGLRRLGQKHEATLSMTLLAALAAVAHRATGEAHIPINISLANRHRAEYHQVIGSFAQLGQVVGDCSGDPRFGELLERVRRWALFVLDRQDQFSYEVVPLLRRHLGLPPEIISPFEPRVGLFFDLRAFRPVPQPIAGLTVEEQPIVDPFAPPDLYFLAIEEERGLRMTLNYSADRYESVAVGRLFDAYMDLLAELAAGANPRLSAIHPG